MVKISKEEWEKRIKEAGAGRYEFVRWAVDGEFASRDKCVVRCVKDGYAWESTVNNLVNHGHGCYQCAGKRRLTADERIEHINSLENIEFVSWVNGYKNSHSKAIVRCKIDGFIWMASVNSIVNTGSGCPQCSNHGYDTSKAGTLYALRSECGKHVKVGISNNPKRRHNELERSTPFKFNIVEQISGDGVKIAELEKHFHNKYESAGFVGFDGCTEWLVCSDELLSELRRISIESEHE